MHKNIRLVFKPELIASFRAMSTEFCSTDMAKILRSMAWSFSVKVVVFHYRKAWSAESTAAQI